MKKVIVLLGVSATFLFSAMNLQTASKKELMCIKGIGDKKAQAIIEYRKKNKIKSADDLLKLKGFGKGLIENIKKENKVKRCERKAPKRDTKNMKQEPKKTDNKDSKK
jgi:competence protein ComEA